MVFKPRVLLGFHPNPRFLESMVGKTLNGTRKVCNPPFEVGFMVKLQMIELGFRTNPNKSLYLGCVWIKTHFRIVLRVIHERFLKKNKY